jgi:GH15 family glucan-1,4-alpha-glucosidase
MATPLEDYGLIGDLQTAALVSRSGSIDWLCLPRFDSGAVFAALLGDESHGRWSLNPVGRCRPLGRRYRGDTLVLETDIQGEHGAIRLIDFMPPRGEAPDLVRIVEGLGGSVEVEMELVLRFDYGHIVPWVHRIDGTLAGVAGPDAVTFATPVELVGEDMRTHATFTVHEGDRIPFVLTWYPSHRPLPEPVDAEQALLDTERYWQEWEEQCTHGGAWHDDVHRSLMVLKALTFAPTGGMVAAPTTSLPEALGGVRNWDYRFCWLRDATLTLLSLVRAGYVDEARAWRDWLLRAIAGNPGRLQVMYGVAGERRLVELELDWLPGYEGSQPVRIGNGAWDQLQLDVYGEIIDALYQARVAGLEGSADAWNLARKVFDWLEEGWREPDEGIWEVRGGRRHFTHSKVMCWVAFDRAVNAVELLGRAGPVERWRSIRDEIKAQVLEEGWNAEVGAFVQSYGSDRLDASLLMLPLVGFLPAKDPRMVSTVAAIERDLLRDGFVERYRADAENVDVDGLPPGEGAFLPCSFWLVQNLALQGRRDEALELFERLLSLRNDLGLISEEYDPGTKRLVGNFPQAFTHLALVDTAVLLSEGEAMRSVDGRPHGAERARTP